MWDDESLGRARNVRISDTLKQHFRKFFAYGGVVLIHRNARDAWLEVELLTVAPEIIVARDADVSPRFAPKEAARHGDLNGIGVIDGDDPVNRRGPLEKLDKKSDHLADSPLEKLGTQNIPVGALVNLADHFTKWRESGLKDRFPGALFAPLPPIKRVIEGRYGSNVPTARADKPAGDIGSAGFMIMDDLIDA